MLYIITAYNHDLQNKKQLGHWRNYKKKLKKETYRKGKKKVQLLES